MANIDYDIMQELKREAYYEAAEIAREREAAYADADTAADSDDYYCPPELIARETAAREGAHAALRAAVNPVHAALDGWLRVHAPALRAA